jgi:hypothetical protein
MKIAERIARDLGAPDLVDKLIALPANELTSLFLEVTRRRQRTPADLLAQLTRDRNVRPTADDPRLLLAVEAHAFAAASAFEPVTLSPVAPLGLNTVLGEIDQNSVLAAARNLEVLADPTTVMALLTAQRMSASGDDVRLAAAARMLRLQPFDNPAFSPHFAIFALTTGGRGRPSYDFELAALEEHLAAHLDFYDRLAATGYQLADVRVEVSDSEGDEARLAAVEAGVFPSLRARFGAATFALDRARTHAMAYYRGLCLHIVARDPDGVVQQLSDGGSTDWLARLTANKKRRFFISGLGSELLLRRFRR